MFDSYTIHPTVDHHHYTRAEITEKRAPTDASVKLLREMERAARDEVIKAVALESNLFKGVIHYSCDSLSLQHIFVSVYELNGVKMHTRSAFNEWDSVDQIAQGIVNDVARDVAVQIIAPAFSAAVQNALPFRRSLK